MTKPAKKPTGVSNLSVDYEAIIARNPDWRQSAALGLRYGLWELPFALLCNVGTCLAAVTILAIVLPLVTLWTLLAGLVISAAGLVGCITPKETP